MQQALWIEFNTPEHCDEPQLECRPHGFRSLKQHQACCPLSAFVTVLSQHSPPRLQSFQCEPGQVPTSLFEYSRTRCEMVFATGGPPPPWVLCASNIQDCARTSQPGLEHTESCSRALCLALSSLVCLALSVREKADRVLPDLVLLLVHSRGLSVLWIPGVGIPDEPSRSIYIATLPSSRLGSAASSAALFQMRAAGATRPQASLGVGVRSAARALPEKSAVSDLSRYSNRSHAGSCVDLLAVNSF